MEMGDIVQVGLSVIATAAICLSMRKKVQRNELKRLQDALESLKAEMAKTKELSEARQRNFEREMVRSGALSRENAELVEKLSRVQAGRGGFVPRAMTLYLN